MPLTGSSESVASNSAVEAHLVVGTRYAPPRRISNPDWMGLRPSSHATHTATTHRALASHAYPPLSSQPFAGARAIERGRRPSDDWCSQRAAAPLGGRAGEPLVGSDHCPLRYAPPPPLSPSGAATVHDSTPNSLATGLFSQESHGAAHSRAWEMVDILGCGGSPSLHGNQPPTRVWPPPATQAPSVPSAN